MRVHVSVNRLHLPFTDTNSRTSGPRGPESDWKNRPSGCYGCSANHEEQHVVIAKYKHECRIPSGGSSLPTQFLLHSKIKTGLGQDKYRPQIIETKDRLSTQFQKNARWRSRSRGVSGPTSYPLLPFPNRLQPTTLRPSRNHNPESVMIV